MTDRVIWLLAKAVIYILSHAKFTSAGPGFNLTNRTELQKYVKDNNERFDD